MEDPRQVLREWIRALLASIAADADPPSRAGLSPVVRDLERARWAYRRLAPAPGSPLAAAWVELGAWLVDFHALTAAGHDIGRELRAALGELDAAGASTEPKTIVYRAEWDVDSDEWDDESTTDKLHALAPVRAPDADDLDVASPPGVGALSAAAPRSGAFERRPTTEDDDRAPTDPTQPPAVTAREIVARRSRSRWRASASWGATGLIAGVALSAGFMIAIYEPAERAPVATVEVGAEVAAPAPALPPESSTEEPPRAFEEPAEQPIATDGTVGVTVTPTDEILRHDTRERIRPAPADAPTAHPDRVDESGSSTLEMVGSSDIGSVIVHERRWTGRGLTLMVTVINRGTAEVALTGFWLVGEDGNRVRLKSGPFDRLRMSPQRSKTGEIHSAGAVRVDSRSWTLVVESDDGIVAEVTSL